MREDHHDIQTPKKENLPVSSNRKVKSSINAQSKKLHHQQPKSIKKNLSSVFTPIVEEDVVLNLAEKESIEKISSISDSADVNESTVEISETSINSNQVLVTDNAVVLQHPEESVGNCPISEAFVFDEDQSSKSMERYIASLDQFISPSSATLGSVENTPFSSSSSTKLSSMSTVEMTPSSSQITAEPVIHFVASVTSDGATTEETDSFHLESLVKHLRNSMSQVSRSTDIDLRYKKLLDALVKVVIEEFYSLHEERHMVVELFSRKVKIVLLSFGLCILLISSGFILSSDVQSSYYGPPPT